MWKEWRGLNTLSQHYFLLYFHNSSFYKIRSTHVFLGISSTSHIGKLNTGQTPKSFWKSNTVVGVTVVVLPTSCLSWKCFFFQIGEEVHHVTGDVEMEDGASFLHCSVNGVKSRPKLVILDSTVHLFSTVCSHFSPCGIVTDLHFACSPCPWSHYAILVAACVWFIEEVVTFWIKCSYIFDSG